MGQLFSTYLFYIKDSGFLNPELPARNKPIDAFLAGKFPFYTRVCNFADYRIPFTIFLIKVLRLFQFHLSQVNPFGLSCMALGRKPDLNVFQYFYEFIRSGDWYTFAQRKFVPSPSSDEKSSLNNWKDHFFWLDDLADMAWRFNDQSIDFELKEDFAFD
ncbi:hypothetical protein Hanom_Chr00s160591g01825251 [Helianthus anomalus]